MCILALLTFRSLAKFRYHYMITLLLIFITAVNMAEAAKEPLQSVQVFGRKKSATAVAYCKRGKGLIKVVHTLLTHAA